MWEVGDIIMLSEAGKKFLSDNNCAGDIKCMSKPRKVELNRNIGGFACVYNDTGGYYSPQMKHFDLAVVFETEYV